MARNVFSRFRPVALTTVGWVVFCVGTLVKVPALLRVILLVVARVLPQAL